VNKQLQDYPLDITQPGPQSLARNYSKMMRGLTHLLGEKNMIHFCQI